MKTFTIFVASLWSICISLAAQTPVQLSPEELALFESAQLGNLDKVERLVSEGTAVDAKDPDHRTPMMFAAFNGHTAVVGFLVGKGAEVDNKDINGRTALMYASSGPFAETVDLLVKRGADPNVQGTLEGFTPLMTAAAEGLVDVVRLLLAAGADRAIEDKDGDTALSFARANGHTEVVTLLESPPDRE